MATAAPTRPVVTLTREQRDGLHEFVISYIGVDLSHATGRGNWQVIRETATILNDCLPILDGIGWDQRGTEASYELIVDDALLRVARAIRPEIEATLRDDMFCEDPGLDAADRAALEAVELIEAGA